MKSYAVAIILLFIGQTSLLAQGAAITFKDVSNGSGLDVSHISTPENRYIIESMSGGAVVFDCNNDGFLDIATVNGSSVENFKKGGNLFVTLYQQIDIENEKTLKFENITSSAGLNRKGWGMGITAVDFDNDGILDLFISGFEGNAVYRGKGGCKFEDTTEKNGLKGTGFQTGIAWADYDRDGDLDAFVAGYVRLDLDNLPVFGSSKTCSYHGIRVQCGPRGLPGERDFLYRNKGDGTFEEVAEKAGVFDKNEFYGLGAVWADYDNDGWLDLYVANDGGPNYLYKNERDGTFADVSFESGTSYSGEGVEQGSMGVTIEDYNLDGRLDIFVTNFETEHNTLYQNFGSKGFIDYSTRTRIGQNSKPYVGWGTSLTDFDNDGWLDLFSVNGHVYPQLEFAEHKKGEGFVQYFLLQRNLGDGKFEDITDKSGLNDIPLLSRRGAAFGDLNNDGYIDVVVTNLGEKPTVLLNMSYNKNEKIIIRLLEDGKNKEAIGARVTIKTDRRLMTKEIQAGASYISQNDFRLHFGMGTGEKIESAEVRWSLGKTERINGLQLNKFVTIKQGTGIIKTEDFK